MEDPIAFFGGIVIMLLFFLPNAFWCLRLAKRKGKSKHYFWLGLTPFFGIYFSLWLSSHTDQSVLDELDKLSLNLYKLRNAVDALQKS